MTLTGKNVQIETRCSPSVGEIRRQTRRIELPFPKCATGLENARWCTTILYIVLRVEADYFGWKIAIAQPVGSLMMVIQPTFGIS
jgi:hypothetical protein